MSPVSCPSCGEKGNLSDQLIGKKLRCQKCGTSFVAGATTSSAPSPAPLAEGQAKEPAGDTIEVDGLDASTWASTAVAVAVETHAPEPERHEPGPAIMYSPPQGIEPFDGPARQYKVLTQKDRWFEGKFELGKLEEALNHYARQGWVVRAMATPHVTGFSGGPREEIVILMER